MMNAKELLKARGRDAVRLDAAKTIEDAIRIFHAEKVCSVLVTENGVVAGIFTESDIVRCHVEKAGVPFSSIMLGDIMVRNLLTVDSTDDLCLIMTLMVEKNIRHIPVRDQGEIVGMFSMRDIIKAQVQNLRSEINTLKDYIVS